MVHSEQKGFRATSWRITGTCFYEVYSHQVAIHQLLGDPYFQALVRRLELADGLGGRGRGADLAKMLGLVESPSDVLVRRRDIRRAIGKALSAGKEKGKEESKEEGKEKGKVLSFPSPLQEKGKGEGKDKTESGARSIRPGSEKAGAPPENTTGERDKAINHEKMKTIAKKGVRKAKTLAELLASKPLESAAAAGAKREVEHDRASVEARTHHVMHMVGAHAHAQRPHVMPHAHARDHHVAYTGGIMRCIAHKHVGRGTPFIS